MISTIRSRKIFTLYLVMTAITLILSVGLGELLARLFVVPHRLPEPLPIRQIDPYRANPYMVNARPYIHFHTPGSEYIQARSSYRVKYEINRRGFRGPEMSPTAPPGLKRLLIIGDSMVEGHGSEFNATFASLLNTNLQPLGWEVVNVGVQGGSPIYYAANLERYLDLTPDAVLIILFENDIYDDRVLEANFFKLPLLDDEIELLDSKAWLTHSSLYILFRRAWKQWIHSPFEEIVLKNQKSNQTNAEQQELAKLSPYLVAPSLFASQWAMSQAYLDYVVETLRHRDVQILIASLCLGTIAPGVNDSYREHAYNLDNQVNQWATARHLPFLSLLPVVTRAFAENPLTEVMIADDGHLAKTSQRVLKEALQPWLQMQLKMKTH